MRDYHEGMTTSEQLQALRFIVNALGVELNRLKLAVDRLQAHQLLKQFREEA